MLAELLHLIATPAPLSHRRIGCVADSVRLASRARRCRRAWAPHQARTRAAILASAARAGGRRTAIVLGSGPLDDVPLAELADLFARVVLVDAVHPWRARRLARSFANVERITADLSGSFALLLGRADGLQPGLPPLCSAPEVDFVASVNLLSQLPIRPVERLENAGRAVGAWRPEEGELFGRAIVEAHLAELSALEAPVCLVTDLGERELDRSGREVAQLDLLYGARLGPPDETWDWELAPFGEAARDRRLVHRVVAHREWGDPLRRTDPSSKLF